MSSVWDDPSLNVVQEYVKFETPGDQVEGVVRSVAPFEWPDGNVAPQIILDTPDGERSVTAGQVQLKSELARLRPEPGDSLRIEFTGVESRPGGKTLKLFNVSVTRADSSPATTAAAAAPTTDAEAARMAMLREQLAP